MQLIYFLNIFISIFFVICENNYTISEQLYDKIQNETDLFFVYTQFRHGIRSPMFAMDRNYKDILNNSWKGIGELTPKGIKQHYLLGQKNKKKYKNFINMSEYNPKEILVYSSDVNRTIMSAQAQLYGMFENIPIPIHTYHKKNQLFNDINIEETFKYDHDGNCKKFNKIREKNEKTDIYLKFATDFYNNYSDFIKTNISKFKFTKNNEMELKEIRTICDTFLSCYYDEKNLSIFNFTLEGDKNKNFLFKFLNSCNEYHYIEHLYVRHSKYASFIGLLTTSPIIDQMINLMENSINTNKKFLNMQTPKLVINSGHDITISSMESLMKNLFNIELRSIPFATNLFFELRKNKSNNEFIIYYFYNDELLLNISYNEFKNKFYNNRYTDVDLHNFCDGFSNKDKLITWMIIIIITLLIIIIFIILYFCFKKKDNFIQMVETK